MIYVSASILIWRLGIVELYQRTRTYPERVCIEQRYIYAEPYTGDPSRYPWVTVACKEK